MPWKWVIGGLIAAYIFLWIGGSMSYNYIFPPNGPCITNDATNTTICHRHITQRTWGFWGPLRAIRVGAL